MSRLPWSLLRLLSGILKQNPEALGSWVWIACLQWGRGGQELAEELAFELSLGEEEGGTHLQDPAAFPDV